MDKQKKVGVSDFVMLSDLEEGALLKNLQDRFDANLIYTSIGPVVVSVNPYKSLPLYGQDMIEQYRGKYIYDLPPHLYAVSENAYRDMSSRGRDQCIIIAGESGAGKTEASKRIMEYIAAVSGSTDQVDRVKNHLLQSNPVLEAFGNAKTNRNNNSSRFGKYMDIQFDFHGNPVAGCITNYLLEKSRVVDQAEGERNFHVFYQLLTSTYAKSFNLDKDPKRYNYLKRGNCFTIPNVNDTKEFEVLQMAMKTVGIKIPEQEDIFSILASILHLGNVEFKASGEGGSQVQNREDLTNVASLLGTTYDALCACMTHRTVATRQEKVQTRQTAEQAAYTRDALAKGLYDRLFTWLVERINQNIQPSGDVSGTSVIGVLDIYGFEIFKQNSFEQFCINFCNEKLQQIFIDLTLKSEQEEYDSEGIEWRNIEYFNNSVICDLIEKPPNAILSILDEECVRPGNPTDKDFLEKLDARHKGHAHYESRQTNRADKTIDYHQFKLKHYAGDVTYTVDGFLDKNTDTLLRDVKETMFSAKHGILPHLFPDGETMGHVSKRPVTSGYTFKASLNKLTKNLKSKAPHYIRCIKPNATQQPGIFDKDMALHQVRYLGLMENVRVRRAGYAFRQDYGKFVNRYRVICPDVWPTYRGGSDQDAALLILKTVQGLGSSGFKTGRTKIFIKAPQTISTLEEERERHMPRMATIIQTKMRAFLARRRVRRMKGALKIQRRFRLFKSRRYMREVIAAFEGVANRSDLGKSQVWPTPTSVLEHFSAYLQRVFRLWRSRTLLNRLTPEEQAKAHRLVLSSEIFGKDKPWRLIKNAATANYLSAEPGFDKVDKLCKSGGDSEVLFADTIQKVSRGYKSHKRHAILTNKRLMLVNEKFNLCKNKVFSIGDIEGLTMSQHADGNIALRVGSGETHDLILDFAYANENHLADFVVALAMAIHKEKALSAQTIASPFRTTFGDAVEICTKKGKRTLKFEPGGDALPVSTQYKAKGRTIVARCREF